MPKLTDETLLEILTEQRRVYDDLNVLYTQVRTKIVTFFGAGLALAAFLYRDGELFFPTQLYGQIFYSVGALLFIASLVILFIALRSVLWSYPTDLDRLSEANFKDRNAFLLYMKGEYLKVMANNLPKYEMKQRLLAIGSYQLIIGGIMLIVINVFGG